MVMKKLTFQGNPVHLRGDTLDVGERCPEFRVIKDFPETVSFDRDELQRQVHIITSAVSVDTGTCANQFREFDRRAADLQEDGISTWFISRDLPFALDRFAEEHGIEHVQFFSDFKEREFGAKLGLTIDEFDLLARAVLVVDTSGEVIYEQIVEEVSEELDYKAAVEAARKAAG